MRARWHGVLLVGAIVGAVVVAGCSDNGEAVTPTGDLERPEPSETTAAPETTTTAAPETTTTAASESSDTTTEAASATSETSNDTMWGLVIIIALVLIGLVAWGASRSGAQKGAQEQAQRDAYQGETPPPPPAE